MMNKISRPVTAKKSESWEFGFFSTPRLPNFFAVIGNLEFGIILMTNLNLPITSVVPERSK